MTIRPHLLVVDDEAGIRESLSSILTDEGYDVESAANGAEALATARHSPPCLVIADLLMPVMDG